MNIKDVATSAGVSVATVSRVLNPESSPYPVRAETRERVLKVVEELGYRPNDLARALLRRRTNVAGLLIPDISNPYYPEVARGVEDGASGAGWRVVLCNTDRNPEKTKAYLEALIKARADGIIVIGGSEDGVYTPELLQSYGVGISLVGRHDLPYPSVQIDNVEAARNATAHLLALGHRRIGFIAGPMASHTVQDRIVGYRDALSEAGVREEPRFLRVGDFQEGGGYTACQALLGSERRPTAVIAANDRMAFGAMAAIADEGLRVPGDVSVVGFDDVPQASYWRPALTTVAIPSYDIGRRAMDLLLEGSRADGAAAGEVLPTKLVIRESCSRPPGRKRATSIA